MKKLLIVLMVIAMAAFLLVGCIPVTPGEGEREGEGEVTVALDPAPVLLGLAGNFVILTKTGISTTGVTSIVGDIGVSPIAASAITGFGLILDASNEFSTSSLVTGKVYAADYAPPTPANMTTAVSDMETAFTDAAGRTLPDYTELGAGDISGMTLAPGLYKWGTGVLITSVGVTLSGGANDVWIFQIAGDLTVSNSAMVTLSGGAQAKNIFWQVSGQATLGTAADFKGIILSQTLISLNTGAVLNGRALAQTAVTLNATTVGATIGHDTVAVTGVTLDRATMTLTAGGATGTLVATVAPANATNKSITWSSSAPAVATVANGVVTPLTGGTTTITVATVDGSFTATCEVTVLETLPVALGPAPVLLGSVGNFVILSKTGITNVPTSTITGDIGTSPITGASITGLGCSEVTGTIYTVDAAGPACRVEDPVLLTAAVSDMETAFTDAAGRTLPDYTELGAGDISGMTLAPGLYKWGTGVLITSVGVTLSGGANDVWIFQIAGDLTVSNSAMVTLSGGAQAKNIFWQVSGQATLGTAADFKGIILSQTLISLNTGAVMNGRALAQTAVTLNATTIAKPN